MANDLKPIKAFPNDGRPWRVDWFGSVHLNSKIHDEPTIEVIISPFIGDRNNPSALRAVVSNEQNTIRVGVGQLPIIYIGSIWQNQMPLPLHDFRYDQKTFQQISISPETTQFIKSDYKENGIFRPDMYRVGPKTGNNARCLCVNYQNDPFGIIIPVAEIIRFYYAQSSAFARILFNGEFCETSEVLYNGQESFLDEDGFAAIKLRMIFSDNDAWVAARIAFSEIANKNAKRIHETLLLNSRNEHMALPEVGMPFIGITTLKAHTKRIQSLDGRWRYLVLWLNSCSAPFPFERLTVIRDNDGRPPENTANEDERIDSGWPKKKPKDENDGEIKDDEPPSDDYEPTKFTIDCNRFSYLENKFLEKFPKERSKYKAGRQKPFLVEGNPDGYSTGGTTAGKSNTAPGNFNVDPASGGQETDATRYAMPVSFNGYIEGLNELASRDGFTYRMVKASDEIASLPFGQASYFPTSYNGERLLWSYYKYRPKAERERRQVLIAEVQYGARIFYFMEIQRRETEHYTMLMAYGVAFQQFSQTTLNEILLDCARNDGKWLDDTVLREYRRHKIKHSWDSSEKFADKIIELLTNAC